MVLFDLGGTLEEGDVLRPGAVETLQAIADLRIGGRRAVLLALLSDFTMSDDPDEVPAIEREYYAILDGLGIRSFFEPVDRRVTLSTRVGVPKPAPAMFRAAVAKAEPALGFRDVLFVTENAEHVRAARRLGLHAARVSSPGHPDGDVSALPDLLPLVDELLGPDADQDAGPAPTEGWERLGAEVGLAGPDGERLHLVTQNGRLFQADHPDVPVLEDHGRHLVVDLAPERAAQLGADGGACWALRPLPAGAVVLSDTVQLARWEVREPVPHLAGLSADEFAADLATLAGHRTRHSASQEFDEAASWAAQRLAASGCAVAVEPVPEGGPGCRNVVGDRRGVGPEPREVVLVTAHLDSVNRRGAGAPAPGADDNASGSAGVLALARAVAGLPLGLDLRFVLFGGEEQGLLGSRRHVARLSGPERARVRAVVNMDMIGVRNGVAPGVLLEGAAVSAEVIDALAAAAAEHTGLAVTKSFSPFNSDHVSFIDAGIPAVLTIEAGDEVNTAVHTEGDRVETIDHELALEILRMNLAFVVATTGLEESTPIGAVPSPHPLR
ncbi:M20/M25/M40 family metallo-hydrolase [Geodermatophilus sp. SYSU D00691]